MPSQTQANIDDFNSEGVTPLIHMTSHPKASPPVPCDELCFVWGFGWCLWFYAAVYVQHRFATGGLLI